jgi:hypothetical protein
VLDSIGTAGGVLQSCADSSASPGAHLVLLPRDLDGPSHPLVKTGIHHRHMQLCIGHDESGIETIRLFCEKKQNENMETETKIRGTETKMKILWWKWKRK